MNIPRRNNLTAPRRAPLLVCIVALLSAILACGPSGSGLSPSDRATGLAQTAAALLTSTAVASITPQTPTPQPTGTPVTPTAGATATTAATATVALVTDTPVPVAVASPTPTACPKDDSDFVTDVDVPDGTHFAPGSAFNKTWRLRNSGPCTWTTAYTFRNVSGEPMGAGIITLPKTVLPGENVDLTVAFIAPAAVGDHVSRWQMFSPGGIAFGTKPYVQIKVP